MGEAYFPPTESQGGWRTLDTPQEVRDVGGMDPRKLALAAEHNAFQASTTTSFVVIRHGWLVAEWYEASALATTRYDIWSAVKSITGTAYGVLFGERPDITLDTLVYEHLPEGHPLTDPRKAQITLGHLLSMTSGIPGAAEGIAAIPTATGVGPFEAALGFKPCWTRRWGEERWASTLTAAPGEHWDYSDPAFAHLGMAFTRLAGMQLRDFVQDRLWGPIGVEQVSWDLQGVGTRFGPHTNAHTGVHISARELARLGYLMLRRGTWNGTQIVPQAWVEQATRPSQQLNKSYGYTWWVGAGGRPDGFGARGLHANVLIVVPSLDLVVVRIGNGPIAWSEAGVIGKVVGAVVEGR